MTVDVTDIHEELWRQTHCNTEHSYHLADTFEKRAELIKTLNAQKSICFDTETTGTDANQCELVAYRSR